MPDQGERDVSFKLPGTLTSSALSRARGPASRAGQAENIHCSPASPSKRTTIFSAASRAAGQEMTVTAKDKQEALAVETDDDFILYTSPGRLEDDLRRLGLLPFAARHRLWCWTGCARRCLHSAASGMNRPRAFGPRHGRSRPFRTARRRSTSRSRRGGTGAGESRRLR